MFDVTVMGDPVVAKSHLRAAQLKASAQANH
jgi:hypothetical protein